MSMSIDYNGITYQNFDYETLVELLSKEVVDEMVKQNAILECQALRKQAYKDEADPLYLEWQYDNSPEKEQQWRDKVAEIKARYPLD